MKTRKNQSGFAILELVLVVVIVAVLAGAGWWVYNRQHKSSPAASNSTASNRSSSGNVSPAPQIKTSNDLDQALQVLNQNDPATANSSDTSQLNSQTSAF